MNININLSDYEYQLDDEKIAFKPSEKRADSKLLVINCQNSNISEKAFSNITEILPNDSMLFVNETKVISARINMKKLSGGRAEVLLTEPISPSSDPLIALNSKQKCNWTCIIGGPRIKEGTILENEYLIAKILRKNNNIAEVEFTWNKNFTFGELISELGNIPLPPYIKRTANESDKERYQTLFAQFEGSVAAPTAALHFDDNILQKLNEKNVNIQKLLLHVGLGTFKPIESERIEEHKMHGELFSFDIQNLKSLVNYLQNQKTPFITCTGTTSLRTLESIYLLGKKLVLNQISEEELIVKLFDQNVVLIEQWDSFHLQEKGNVGKLEAFSKILEVLENHNINQIKGRTELLIAPGYIVQSINALITNFHAPKSTLILLVASIMGRDLWLKSYDYALDNNFRFLSYGDSSIIFL